jgi:hypothetical protein
MLSYDSSGSVYWRFLIAHRDDFSSLFIVTILIIRRHDGGGGERRPPLTMLLPCLNMPPNGKIRASFDDKERTPSPMHQPDPSSTRAYRLL